MRDWLVLAIGSLAAVSPAQTAPRAATATVSGRVVDEQGAPLANVAVCALDASWLTRDTAEVVRTPAAVTGADGRYAASVPAAARTLLFVAAGRVHVATPLHPHDGWPVVLPRARTLAGRVVDAAGLPAAGVRVEARDWLRSAPYRHDAARLDWLPELRTAVRTDARGRFVLTGVVEAGVELIVGERDGVEAQGPFALGDAIELVWPSTARELERSRAAVERVRNARAGDPVRAAPAADAPGVVAIVATGGPLPPWGASVKLLPGPAARGFPGAFVERGPGCGGCTPLDGDGRALLAVAPGRYRLALVVPRPLHHGAPDVIEVREVDVDAATREIELDLREHAPVRVRGTVRGPVPAGRLLVGVARERTPIGFSYGYAAYQCPLATVAPDGGFELRTPPGVGTPFVIDLWTGMLLGREVARELRAGEELTVGLRLEVGAVDVAVRAMPYDKAGWLELCAPDEAWPRGIDMMEPTPHESTKRIGCDLTGATAAFRLWLPAGTFGLWLTEEMRSVGGARGETTVDVRAGATVEATLSFPR
jgi:hypothetical protein